jgi:DnaK suppressor protein
MNQHEQLTFKAILLEIRARLVREIRMSEDALREDVRHPGELSNVPTHPADHDAEGLDEELAIAQNEEGLLNEVVAALERVDKETFGTCQDCGREIERERLVAIPYTSRCIECARRLSRDSEPAHDR